ncbi:hypothetical protein [Pseudomonas sp. EL_65y_Pfl2_R95]|uniref:hypothetical protein n=1 Tax=Pseudomonas sp. EL_65y_Pfl2_R95 TaxID=3088698 RepID=UPI0030D837CA
MSAYSIKDYRNPLQYPAREGINAWRWEFLRRNPEYQRLYEAHKDCVTPPSEVSSFGVRNLYDPRFDDAYQGFLAPSHILELPNFAWVEKWKLVPGYTTERGMHMLLRALTELQLQGDTLAVINRALPLEPQLDAIRESVAQKNKQENNRPPLGNDRRGEWTFYLRVLDGFADGASYDELAAALYPGSENAYPDFSGRKRVKKALERAVFLSQTFGTKSFVLEK